jgi:bifunctional enzyme CysN/CysC
LEVWVQTPLHVCESRDPKGLYRRARSGDISDFTGVSAPYEEPETPDVVLDTEMASPGACAGAVVHALWRTWREADGWI